MGGELNEKCSLLRWTLNDQPEPQKPDVKALALPGGTEFLVHTRNVVLKNKTVCFIVDTLCSTSR